MSATVKFDRSKIKPTQMSDLNKQEEEAKKVLPKKFESNRPGIVTHKDLEEGLNKIRIFPAHPESLKKTFMYLKVIHFLPAIVDDKDAKKKHPSDKQPTKVGKITVFNSKVHGGTPKDIVDEYISFATKVLEDTIKDPKKLQDKIDKLVGSFARQVNGITAVSAWQMYAKINGGELKRFEISENIREKMKKCSHTSADDVIETDPFTDIDEGRLMLLTKLTAKGTKPQDMYSVKLDDSFDRQTKMITFAPLTNEELEEWANKEKLETLLVNSYKKSDFERAYAGLLLFDELNEFGVFEYEPWIEICNEIAAYYPDEEEEGATKATAAAPKSPDGEEEEEEEEEEGLTGLDGMDRTALKGYIRENKLAITPTKAMSDQHLRDLIVELETKAREANGENILPWDKAGKESEKSEAVMEPKTATSAKQSTKDRLSGIINKRKS